MTGVLARLCFVIPRLVPGIYVFAAVEDVDGRNKSGHDGRV